MPKSQARKAMFSLSPVDYRNSPIAGRGVFARKRFAPGDVIAPYAPKQRKVDADSAEAIAAADTKLTLLSERVFVIIPDTSVPGGWLTNHSCNPNAALYSSGEGRIQCLRRIAPGEEVTIFYGWVTENEPGRDPCRCGSATCRGTINFDVTDDDARALETETDTDAGAALRERLSDYAQYVHSIGQEQVIATLEQTLTAMRARLGI
jgi:SET domain-containing protein